MRRRRRRQRSRRRRKGKKEEEHTPPNVASPEIKLQELQVINPEQHSHKYPKCLNEVTLSLRGGSNGVLFHSPFNFTFDIMAVNILISLILLPKIVMNIILVIKIIK